MNYIKEAENRLWYYRDLQKSIDEMTRQVARLIAKTGPKELKAIVMDQTGVRGGHHDDALNIIYEIQTLQESMAKTREGFEEIESILREISQDDGCEKYGQVLRKWYIQRLSKEVIAEDFECSVRTVYYLRDAAIRKFAVRIFGIEALKVI